MQKPSHPFRKPEAGDYFRLRSALYAWCLRRGWDPDLADEVVQRTFEECLRRRTPLSDSLPPILFRRARGHAAAALRERLHTLGDDDAKMVKPIQNEDYDPEQIEAAIKGLPPRLRQVLLLLARNGGTRSAVAERLGVSRTHLSVLLHRARARLSAEFDGPAGARGRISCKDSPHSHGNFEERDNDG